MNLIHFLRRTSYVLQQTASLLKLSKLAGNRSLTTHCYCAKTCLQPYCRPTFTYTIDFQYWLCISEYGQNRMVNTQRGSTELGCINIAITEVRRVEFANVRDSKKISKPHGSWRDNHKVKAAAKLCSIVRLYCFSYRYNYDADATFVRDLRRTGSRRHANTFHVTAEVVDTLDPQKSLLNERSNTSQMTNTMGGAHLCTPQSIFQQMMNQQNPQQQQVGPWMQTPQVPPITIPWSVPALQQSELVRFTGETSSGPILHQKRKLEASDVVNMHQTKQFITEEKIAAHFKDLHISTNCGSESPVPSTSTAHISSCHKQLDMDLDVDATNAICTEQTKELHPRLVLSEELKRMQEEPILPTTLISKLERPSMALVLWEPPNRHLRILPTRDTPTPIPNASDDNNNNNNNNNDTIPDLNNVLPSATSAFEPMEL